MPSAIFIYSPFPFSAYDEKSISIAKWYDLMSIRLWGTGHAYYLYYASYANNSVGNMSLGSKLINRWRLVRFSGLKKPIFKENKKIAIYCFWFGFCFWFYSIDFGFLPSFPYGSSVNPRFYAFFRCLLALLLLSGVGSPDGSASLSLLGLVDIDRSSCIILVS
jgi:hypothetical protein